MDRMYTREEIADAMDTFYMVLDNCKMDDITGDNEMSSAFRKTYSYIDSNGKTQSIRLHGKNQVDTDCKFQNMLVRQASKAKESDTNMTFREFIESIYYNGFLPKKETTIGTYKLFLNSYVLPNIGSLPLCSIRVNDIQKMMDWMANGSKNGLKQDINAGTIKRVIGMLSHIFRIAVDMELISKNPVKTTLLKNNGKPADHHEALSNDEIDRVKREIPHLKREIEKVCVGLLAYTGTRPEEVRGFR